MSILYKKFSLSFLFEAGIANMDKFFPKYFEDFYRNFRTFCDAEISFECKEFFVKNFKKYKIFLETYWYNCVYIVFSWKFQEIKMLENIGKSAVKSVFNIFLTYHFIIL